jgi:hypothetical protein
MGLLDGLFGPRQTQAQGPGLLGSLTQMQQTNPEAFLALGAGLMNGDMAQGISGMGQAVGQYRGDMRQADLQREGWDRQDARFDKTFGLQQAEHNARLQAMGTENAQRQQQVNQTLKWAQSTGDPDIIGLAGAGMFDEAFKVWSAKSAGREPPKIVDRFDPETGQPQKMMWDEQVGDFVPFGGTKAPSNGITVGPDGTVQIGGSMKEGEAKANIYASRMEASNELLNRLETEGTDLSNKLMSGVPVLGNYGVTPEYRQFEQAQRDFINAALRQESGAVISPEEFENGKRQYFPQPGDDPETIAQKARNRQTAIRAIRQASGQPSPPIIGGPQAERPMTGPEAFKSMSDAELEAIINGE